MNRHQDDLEPTSQTRPHMDVHDTEPAPPPDLEEQPDAGEDPWHRVLLPLFERQRRRSR